MNPKEVAKSIAAWAYCDSMVQVDVNKLVDALHEDLEAREGDMPNEAECCQLVCGGDDGQVPTELVERFPATHALLGTYWE